MKYNKVAQFTDIHFGRKNNSESHNQDCIDYITWFCGNVKKDKDIDCIFFLGDWHEHRAAVNGLTLHYSQIAANMLNDLGIPIYFIVGNHDCYYRNNRDVFTTVIFDKLENFTLVDKPTVLPDNNCVLAPYLFEEEYPEFFREYSKYSVIAGHFEFAGFVLAGETVVKEHGPDPKDYTKPKHIFTGHFHKRQSKKNVHYIGSCFPMDFSDANDEDRGMCVYDFNTDDIAYINWDKCPKYVKTTLSEIMENPDKLLSSNSRVKVVVDEDITMSESNEIRKSLVEMYNLREITLEEQVVTTVDLTDIEKDVEDLHLDGVNEIIPELLKRIKSDKIDSTKLVDIYKSL